MQRIHEVDLLGFRSQGSRTWPGGARIKCPACGHRATISFPNFSPGTIVNSKCPNAECEIPLHFVTIEGPGGLTNWQGELWMYPPAPPERRPNDLDGIDDLPEGLRDDYREAVDLFNQRYWRASAAAAGRVVEGIARVKTGTDHMLGRLRTELEAHGFTGLAQEVLTAVSDARNAAAHYDQRATIGARFAEAMLDLADSVIDLAFLAPRRISLLVHLIAGGTEDDTEIADITRRAAELRRVYQAGGMKGLVEWLARVHPPADEASPGTAGDLGDGCVGDVLPGEADLGGG